MKNGNDHSQFKSEFVCDFVGPALRDQWQGFGEFCGRLGPGLVAELLRMPGRIIQVAGGKFMLSFILWCILFVMCWPLALLALVLYPIVWLILLPFRIVGIAVDGVLQLVKAIIFLPVRVLRGAH
jgi:hypothetical protein